MVAGDEADVAGDACWETVTNRRGNRRGGDRRPAGEVVAVQALRVSSTVVRGCDWNRGDEDGGEGSIGVVLAVGGNGWVEVEWAQGKADIYRYGADGKFDLVASIAKEVPRPLPTSMPPSRSCYQALKKEDDNTEDSAEEDAASKAPSSFTESNLCAREAIGTGYMKSSQRSIGSQSTDDDLEALEEALLLRTSSESSANTECQQPTATTHTPLELSAHRHRTPQRTPQNPQMVALAALGMEVLAMATGFVTGAAEPEPKKKVPTRKDSAAPKQPSGKFVQRQRQLHAPQARGARGR